MARRRAPECPAVLCRTFGATGLGVVPSRRAAGWLVCHAGSGLQLWHHPLFATPGDCLPVLLLMAGGLPGLPRLDWSGPYRTLRRSRPHLERVRWWAAAVGQEWMAEILLGRR